MNDTDKLEPKLIPAGTYPAELKDFNFQWTKGGKPALRFLFLVEGEERYFWVVLSEENLFWKDSLQKIINSGGHCDLDIEVAHFPFLRRPFWLMLNRIAGVKERTDD